MKGNGIIDLIPRQTRCVPHDSFCPGGEKIDSQVGFTERETS